MRKFFIALFAVLAMMTAQASERATRTTVETFKAYDDGTTRINFHKVLLNNDDNTFYVIMNTTLRDEQGQYYYYDYTFDSQYMTFVKDSFKSVGDMTRRYGYNVKDIYKTFTLIGTSDEYTILFPNNKKVCLHNTDYDDFLKVINTIF